MLADDVAEERPVEGLHGIGAARAIEPDLEEVDGRAVVVRQRDELGELARVESVVIAGACVAEDLQLGVGGAVEVRLGHRRVAVDVPRAQVDAELEVVLSRRGGGAEDDVGAKVQRVLGVRPRARVDLVGGGVGRPEGHAVVMLGGEDHGSHAGGGEGRGPLVGGEGGGVEDGGEGLVGAPFGGGEGVGAEVEEGVVFEGVPGELAGGGGSEVGRGWRCGLGGGGGEEKGEESGEEEHGGIVSVRLLYCERDADIAVRSSM